MIRFAVFPTMSSSSLSSNVGERNVALHTVIMKVETSKHIRSLACCSMTTDCKSHLVAPAVSTEYPVIQEEAHRRLSEETFDLASEEEREIARTMVSRLHVELGHSDPREMIDSLRRKHAHRLIIATAKKFSCKVRASLLSHSSSPPPPSPPPNTHPPTLLPLLPPPSLSLSTPLQPPSLPPSHPPPSSSLRGL